MGGRNPIVVQSMTTSDTMNIAATVEQIIALANVGCQLVRITAPTVQDAEALKEIRAELTRRGCNIPLAADIHFVPAAAMVAAAHVEKVRINPGNYADRKMFKVRDYSASEYQEELERIHDKFKPLVIKLKSLGRALRIGTNHGSLSDRIMNRYGDSPEGMVQSAFEFADICRLYGFHNFCFSMKASNVSVMVQAYRLLVQRQLERGWDYPLHLGVTEAGDGEDGRVKSALGIGLLLSEGIGDTIRVSLTEASVKEIPVARALAEAFPKEKRIFASLAKHDSSTVSSENREAVDYDGVPEVWSRVSDLEQLKNNIETSSLRPDVLLFDGDENLLSEIHHLRIRVQSIWGSKSLPKIALHRKQPVEAAMKRRLESSVDFILSDVGEIFSKCDSLVLREPERLQNPSKEIAYIKLETSNDGVVSLTSTLSAVARCGHAFLDTKCRGLLVEGLSWAEGLSLSYSVLQAARRRMSKTEYISCPSCGRTLFDLEETTARIKAMTSHLSGVKIAVMGCIVNGPGEMADADFGYVGGAPGRVNLYVGKECVERNITSSEAPQRLVDLIRKYGRWVEPSLEPVHEKSSSATRA